MYQLAHEQSFLSLLETHSEHPSVQKYLYHKYIYFFYFLEWKFLVLGNSTTWQVFFWSLLVILHLLALKLMPINLCVIFCSRSSRGVLPIRHFPWSFQTCIGAQKTLQKVFKSSKVQSLCHFLQSRPLFCKK